MSLPPESSNELPAPDVEASTGEGVFAQARLFWEEVQALAHDRLHLLALEARQAIIGFAQMLAMIVIAAILVVTAWLAFVGAAIGFAISNGIAWPIAFAVAIVLNLVVAYLLLVSIKRQSKKAIFAGTLRTIRPVPTPAHTNSSRGATG